MGDRVKGWNLGDRAGVKVSYTWYTQRLADYAHSLVCMHAAVANFVQKGMYLLLKPKLDTEAVADSSSIVQRLISSCLPGNQLRLSQRIMAAYYTNGT